MPISEEQLNTWARPGALVSAEATYTSIKRALSTYAWPNGMQYETYLQGSYGNHTNIRGNSDVDVVVEASSNVFFSNVPEAQWASYKLVKGKFNFIDFKNAVSAALYAYYGSELVDETTSDKCIRIKQASDRVPADVIPCLPYQHYSGFDVARIGMSFVTSDGKQIINYPKLHRKNGEAKNTATAGKFKDIVRVMKNARDALAINVDGFSSYFVESLVYNVPNPHFVGPLSTSLPSVLGFLLAADMSSFTAQNGQQSLFGSDSTQWNFDDARTFVTKIAELWIES